MLSVYGRALFLLQGHTYTLSCIVLFKHKPKDRVCIPMHFVKQCVHATWQQCLRISHCSFGDVTPQSHLHATLFPGHKRMNYPASCSASSPASTVLQPLLTVLSLPTVRTLGAANVCNE